MLKIAFEPDVPVAVFQPPACIHSHGHKLQEIRRAGKHCRRKGRKAAEDVWSIPDTAPWFCFLDSCIYIYIYIVLIACWDWLGLVLNIIMCIVAMGNN